MEGRKEISFTIILEKIAVYDVNIRFVRFLKINSGFNFEQILWKEFIS